MKEEIIKLLYSHGDMAVSAVKNNIKGCKGECSWIDYRKNILFVDNASEDFIKAINELIRK